MLLVRTEHIDSTKTRISKIKLKSPLGIRTPKMITIRIHRLTLRLQLHPM